VRKKALIIRYEELQQRKKEFKDKTTVLVGGCFDLIHFGHLKFLEAAKKQGNYLIVALESDEFIKKNKRKISVHQQNERAEILSSLNMIDMVIMLPLFRTNDEYFELVKTVHPSVIAVTKGDSQIENKRKQAIKIGAKVKEVVTNLKDFSTRNIAKVFNL